MVPPNDAEALRDEVAAVLAPMGLRLSEDKTSVCHIDEGSDSLGWLSRSGESRTALAGSKLGGLAGWLVDGLFSFASESVASAFEDDDFCVVD